MKTIKLLHAANPDVDRDAVTQRLTDHLIKLRKTSLASEFIGNDEHSAELGQNDSDEVADDLSEDIKLTWDDDRRIGKRVQLFTDRKKEASGLGHLRDEEIQRLQPLITGVRMAEPESEHWVDEVVSNLHEVMPWMASATKEVWFALRHNAKSGDPIRLPPLLLNGPPGIGKSVWTRRLSELLHIPRCEIDASLGGVGFSVAGTERGWSSAQPGRPLETILQHLVGNPLIVVDEICKAQSGTSDKGAHHAFADTLLNLLEPATSVAWECPYYRAKFDMSHISWVLTANDASLVPDPLLSRCTLIDLPAITCSQLKGFAHRQANRLGLAMTSAEVIDQVIDRMMLGSKPNISLRDVVRMLRRAEVLEDRPIQH